MAKTFSSIQRQIEKLQKEAAALKVKEIGSVVERIRGAIDFYGLTPADLFETKTRAQAKGKRAGAAGSVAKASANKTNKKTESVIKYKDEAGNSWTGHGKRPGWFKAALEAGKTVEDLLVKP